jgi:predicted metalloprotease
MPAMDVERTTSPNVIDHRKVASHGITFIVAMLCGVLLGHGAGPQPDPDADLVAVTSTALDRGDVFWASREGNAWRTPHVVLIPVAGEQTPCGPANEQSGPFYCPVNQRIYLDVRFLRAIHGDLARAYVTAHELGHHVQRVRGELDGRPSIDVELGADWYAGQWMADEQARGHLGSGDVAAALEEAAAVGDDRLCPGCSPEQWTHGSSAQRIAAVRRGIAGQPCNGAQL